MSKSIKTLDEVFSRYIRRRDCPNGIGRCISCGALISYDTCDAGHYIGRAHTATRWNETNVHAQCRICNRHKYGNLKAYRRRLVELYGVEAVEELERMKHLTVCLHESDYRELIEYYKIKLNRL